MRLHPKPCLGALALCLLLTGCGLKAPLFLRMPPTNFQRGDSRLPKLATVTGPAAVTLPPRAGTASTPAAATRSTVPAAITHSPAAHGRP